MATTYAQRIAALEDIQADLRQQMADVRNAKDRKSCKSALKKAGQLHRVYAEYHATMGSE